MLCLPQNRKVVQMAAEMAVYTVDMMVEQMAETMAVSTVDTLADWKAAAPQHLHTEQ